jgi:hypothetical protein
MLSQVPSPASPVAPRQVRTLVQKEMGSALARVDALLTPAAPGPAYRLGEKSADPLAMYKGASARLRGPPPCAQARCRRHNDVALLDRVPAVEHGGVRSFAQVT